MELNKLLERKYLKITHFLNAIPQRYQKTSQQTN